MSSFLSSSYNPGTSLLEPSTRVEGCVFEMLFPLNPAWAHNFSQAYVAYTGIKANMLIQLFEIEPQSPKVSQLQLQLHLARPPLSLSLSLSCRKVNGWIQLFKVE